MILGSLPNNPSSGLAEILALSGRFLALAFGLRVLDHVEHFFRWFGFLHLAWFGHAPGVPQTAIWC